MLQGPVCRHVVVKLQIATDLTPLVVPSPIDPFTADVIQELHAHFDKGSLPVPNPNPNPNPTDE